MNGGYGGALHGEGKRRDIAVSAAAPAVHAVPRGASQRLCPPVAPAPQLKFDCDAKGPGSGFSKQKWWMLRQDLVVKT